jgi:hypothetical protein
VSRPRDAVGGQWSLPYVSGSETSEEAAESMIPIAGTIRRKALDYIRSQGGHGSITEQMGIAIGLKDQTASPRVVELAQAGFILKTRRTRKTTSGRRAAVYVTPEHWVEDRDAEIEDGGTP